MSRVRTIVSFLKARWWIVAIVIVVATVLFLNRGTKENTSSKHTVAYENLNETLTFSGSIDAGEKVTLQFQTGGRIASVAAKEGQKVKRNQLIASLDQRQVRKTLERDLNTYSKERLDFDSEKTQYDEKALPGDKYLRQDLINAFKKSQYDLNNAVLDVELQDIALQYSNLYSPIDGVLVRAGAKTAGVNVLPTQSGYEIVNPETIFFSAAADQTEIVGLHENQEAEIIFDAFPDNKMEGRIISLGYIPEEDETGTVYEVKIGLNNLDTAALMKYRMGMTGDATFIIREYPRALAVPSTYIKTEGDKKFVYKQVNGKTEKTDVTVGELIDTSTIVKSGLQEGDVIYDKAE